MKNVIGFLLAIFLMGSATLFAQSNVYAERDASKAVVTIPDSVQKTKNLIRPKRFENLRQYAEMHLAGSYDEGSLLETQADGKDALTFSLTEGERTTDFILIDHGDSLVLHSDNYPTKWKDLPPTEDREDLKSDRQIEAAAAASVTKTCAGLTSTNNPYPCCSVNGRAGYGNCTYAAWYHMNRFWGASPPSWGNARTWYDNARAAGYPTSRTPALYSVGVNSTMGVGYCGSVACGHVVWIMEISNDRVYAYEQLCGSTSQGIKKTWYSASTFNKGFILSPSNAPSPWISGHSPQFQIWSSPQTQTVRFNTYNVNPGARAVVTYPSGGRSTLKDSQLRLSNYPQQTLEAYMVLNARGWWKIQIFNENGKYSGEYSFWVN